MAATSFSPKDKLLLHPQHLAAFEKNELSAPISIEISVSHLCNAVCPTCWFVVGNEKPHHSRDYMDYAILLGLLDDLEDMGVEAVSWTGGGEPTTHRNINEAIDAAHAHGLKQGMFTNGYIPIKRPELLDWVRLTITDRLTVPKCASEYASKTRTGVNVNLAPWNEDHLNRLVKDAREAGVHYFQVRPALADHVEDQKPIVLPEWLKDYERPGFEVILTQYKFEDYMQPHPYKRCYGASTTPFVWHDGDVNVCAYHKGKPEYLLGNLKQATFKEIWAGEKRRRMTSEGVCVSKTCQVACKLHETNKVLAGIRGEYQLVNDRSFI